MPDDIPRRHWLGYAPALGLGLVLGLAAGGYGGFRSGMSFILNECVRRDARVVQDRIATLRQLRAGQAAEAMESIEAAMDDELVSFDPHTPYPGLAPKTTSEVQKAIRQAREYRLAHPRESMRRAGAKMAANLLQRER